MSLITVFGDMHPEFIYVVVFVGAFLVNRTIAASVFFATRNEKETSDCKEDYFFHENKDSKWL